ncbi:MAG: response regulator [Methanomassiliicoccales archaeon]
MAIRVLCIDDDPSFLQLMEEFLSISGDFEIATAFSGEEALQVIQDRPVDVVVSDYQMPEMDGLELLRVLREEIGSDIPFIMFTGKGREEVAMDALNLGADHYLQKGGDPWTQFSFLAQVIVQERRHWEKSNELRKINWLISKEVEEVTYEPPYGDLTELNDRGEILNSVSRESLDDIVEHFMALLDTSCAIYERNGDYALGIFSSGWCQLLDRSSRALCGTEDNRKALDSGKWLCHESCWNAAKESMERGGPVDVECHGGIRMFAVPIRVNGEIIGSMNFGYGDPPKDEEKLKEIAGKYGVKAERLREISQVYGSRPNFIIEVAKNRLMTSARLLGEMVEKERARRAAQELNRRLKESERRERELNSLLRAIRDVNQMIVQESDVERLMRESCGILMESREYSDVFVALFDGARVSTFRHEGERDREAPDRMIDPEGAKCLRAVMESGSERVITEPSDHCTGCGHCDLEEGDRRIVVPMMGDSSPIGVLFTSLRREVFEGELELLREVAGDLAFALEKMEAEERLRDSERRFSELVERIDNGVAVYEAVDQGKDFVFKSVNRAVEEIEGVHREDILGRRVTEVFPGVEEFGLVEVFRRVWRTGEPEHHPASFYSDGRVAGWRENHVYRLPSGEVVCIYQDVTERRRAEERIRESEQMYRRLFKTVTQGVVYQSLDGRITSANPAAERILGASMEEMNSRTSESPEWKALREDGSVFPGEEHPSMVALRTGEEVTDQVMGVYNPREGRYRWIEIDAIPLFGDGKEPSEVYTIFDDITDTRKRGLRLKERMKELSCLYNVSRLHEERDLDLEELFRRVLDLILPAWRYHDFTRARIVFDGVEYSTPGFTGTEWSLRSDIPVNGIDRGFLEVVYLEGRDEGDGSPFLKEERDLIDAVTDLLGHMVERRESRNREEFLGSLLGHDVRNKLQVALGYTELMEGADSPEDVKGYLRKVRDSLRGNVEIIERVSSLREAQTEGTGEVSIESAIRDAVVHSRTTVERAGVVIDTSGVKDIKVLAGSLLNQIFSNLLENSAYHSGGRMIRIGVEDEGEEVAVTVEDDGSGIPRDKWETIFDKGYTTDRGRGTGLGLFLTRELLDIYGGRIHAGDSDLGGARFDVRLSKPA